MADLHLNKLAWLRQERKVHLTLPQGAKYLCLSLGMPCYFSWKH
jgi:hypothetical protein